MDPNKALTKHSPTPWRTHPVGTGFRAPEQNAGDVAIVTESMYCPAIVWGDGEEGKANSEFIVRACNVHDEMLAALERTSHHQRSDCQGPRCQMNLQKRVCRTCDGSGKMQWSGCTCEDCKGTGKVEVDIGKRVSYSHECKQCRYKWQRTAKAESYGCPVEGSTVEVTCEACKTGNQIRKYQDAIIKLQEKRNFILANRTKLRTLVLAREIRK